jgi:zinc transporter, ZIP family
MATAVLLGTIGGVIAAVATVAGAVPSLFKSRKGFSLATHMSLDFALGMMLAAAAFSLIAPAGQEALERGSSSLLFVLLAIAFGASFIKILGDLSQKIESLKGHFSSSKKTSGAWLFIVAMMLHNLPEGLASGAALAGLDLTQAIPILGAIALQNIPEGLTTAVAFQALGASRRGAFLGAVASALVELLGGTLGGLLLTLVNEILPFLLAFAGGAMIFVAGKEAIERWTATAASAARAKVTRDLGLGMGFMLVLAQVI